MSLPSRTQGIYGVKGVLLSEDVVSMERGWLSGMYALWMNDFSDQLGSTLENRYFFLPLPRMLLPVLTRGLNKVANVNGILDLL